MTFEVKKMVLQSTEKLTNETMMGSQSLEPMGANSADLPTEE